MLHPTLANSSVPDLLWVAAPVLLIVSAVITFELAAALTISTLPRSRAHQQWTPHERRRVTRLFLSVFLIWPALAGAFLAYLFLPTVAAVVVWIGATAVLGFAVYSIACAAGHRRRVMAGHCTGCLYDLRGSLEQDLCPECGAKLALHPAVKRLRKASAAAQQA